MICLIPFPFVPMFWSMVIVCAPAIETVSPSPGTPASFHVVCPLALQLPVAFEVNAAAHAELAGVNHSSSSNDSRMICRFRFEAQKTESTYHSAVVATATMVYPCQFSVGCRIYLKGHRQLECQWTDDVERSWCPRRRGYRFYRGRAHNHHRPKHRHEWERDQADHLESRLRTSPVQQRRISLHDLFRVNGHRPVGRWDKHKSDICQRVDVRLLCRTRNSCA